MPNVADYHKYITSRLRAFEEKRAAGDVDRLHHIATTPDTMLLRKWMLIIACVGFPASVLAMFVLGILSWMLPPFISQTLVVLVKGVMGLSFLFFLVGGYLTIAKSDADGR